MKTHSAFAAFVVCLVFLSTLCGSIAVAKEDPWDDETGGHDKVCARSGISKGTLVTREMLINHNGGDYASGPNGPYHEKYWVIGRTTTRNIAKGSTINGGMLGPLTADQLARQKNENAGDLARLRVQVAETIVRYQKALQAEKAKNGEGSPQALTLQREIASSFMVLENWAESKRYYRLLQANARASKTVDETSRSILLRQCEEQLSRLQSR